VKIAAPEIAQVASAESAHAVRANPLSGAEMVVSALRVEGIDTVWGYPGGAVLPIYDALYAAPSITNVLVRHEQAAVHAADGYARATGKVGVALVTSGPGVTNAVTGIATAYFDSIPLVVICANVPTDAIGKDAFQECDAVGLTRSIVKHNFLVVNVDQLAATLKKAFHIAATGRPGPVVVDIPKDVLLAKGPFVYPQTVELRSYKPRTAGHAGQISARPTYCAARSVPAFWSAAARLQRTPPMKSRASRSASTHRSRAR
jgi:acetolactate synthase I/II/III large subunit